MVNRIFCILYLVGFSLMYAYDDLSYRKVATQSHTQVGPYYDASNAVDGDTATCMRTKEIGTRSLEKTVWWKVDLGGVYHIHSINILFKNFVGYETRQRGRFAGFSLYVSTTGDVQGSTLCYRDGPQLPPLNFTTSCFRYGRYIIFYNERIDGVTYPLGYELNSVLTDLCEVIVLGCQSGVYGNYCAIPCPSNCKDSKCHIQDGICLACEPGWSGASCSKKCREGWYGVNCSQQCTGHCRDGTTCNHVTGRCDGGCAEGRTGSLCDKECDAGTYGYNCLNRCSGHCSKNSACNKQTGNCDVGCEAGFANYDCRKECPSGYFGMNCKEPCSGHCINNEPCDHVSGVCSSGCQDGYIGTYCNDSCREGYYGRNCSHVCPFTCQTCRNTDGLCTCKPGWMGPNCTTECIYSYGTNCVFPCSEHCINQTCDRFDGRCLVGCTEGQTCDPASQQNVETDKDDIACTPWIISFSIVLVTSIITLIIATIKLWRSSLKWSSNAGYIQSSKISASVETQVGLSDGVSHYQELSVSKEHNTYQTLTS